MRAEQILLRSFERDLEAVHLARVRLMFAAVHALLRSARLSLTSLGRAIAGSTSPKHGIKRVDRLLGNRHLHVETPVFYRALAGRLVARGSRPVIIVDWTAVTPKLWALVAAVSYQGRALIVYAETHGIRSYLKPSVNLAFCNRLRSVLPPCTPVVLTDAGFRGPWMNLMQSMGWDFVVRMRGRSRVRMDKSEAWRHLDDLWAQTSSRPKDFGSFEVGRQIRFRTRVVGIRKKAKYQLPPGRPEHGAERQKRSAREPWILGTSLNVSASKVVALYARRMQIEETFRDAKSHRFGICLTHARTKYESRADLLLLLASFAQAVYVLLGIAAEAHRLQKRYQANTTTKRRVLSLPTLGRLVFAEHGESLLQGALAANAWLSLRTAVSTVIR